MPALPSSNPAQFVQGAPVLHVQDVKGTFFKLDRTDPSATTLICAECGRIEWFAQEPERVS
jgi:hypothetical protein